MKHARPDYERFQDPAGIIPKDEPVFLIRGQDKVAPRVLEFWAELAYKYGADNQIVELVKEHAEAMRKWQEKHGNKIPDLP